MNPLRFCARLLRLIVVGGAFAGSVFNLGWAAPAPSVFPDLHIRAWQAEDGLPSNKIMDVLQTRDGFIWIATLDGLVRFDGEKFAVFDESNSAGLLDHDLTCLWEEKDGALWIGHSSGAVTRLKDNRFETTSPKSPPKGIIKSIAADEMGDLWTYSDTGFLVRVKDGFTLQPKAGLAPFLAALTKSPDGKIWVSSAGQISLLQGARLTPIPLDSTDSYALGICAARDGGLWVASGDVIRKYKDGKWLEPICALPNGAPLHVFKETARGQLIAGTSDHGLYLISTVPGETMRQLSRANGFVSDWVLSLCEDREGGVWIGTGGGGLLLLRRKQVDTPAPPDQWQSRAVLSVTPARTGGFWVGTEGAGLYRFRDGQWENFAKNAGIRNPYIWSVVEDSRGELWVGTWNHALYTVADGVFFRAPGVETMNIPMPAIYEASAGGLWVGTSQGLMRYQAGKVSWIEPDSGKQLRDIRTVKEAKDGTVWFGSNGGGLGRVRNGEIRHFGKADGLPGEVVQCLYLDGSGVLWIGTSAGLVRFKNDKFFTLGIDQGLPNAVICDIQEDDAGYVWLSSHGGILRGSKEQLDRCADGLAPGVDFLSYGLSDGMPSLNCSGGMQPAGCKMPDGRLAFATSRGLAIIDPARIETNPIAPPVAIVALRVDGREATAHLASSTRIVISPGSHRLEFQYAGLSFAAPEKVRFKRRLIGLEREWVFVGSKRSADYNYIPPGDYVFQVIACNNDGVWNTIGASLAMTVLPFYWQTIWFKLLVLALLIVASSLLVWFETHRRLQQKLAIANERNRIARDIHDDFGARLTQISMLSATSPNDRENASKLGTTLTQIRETALGLTQAIGEVVWATSPKHDTLESLITYTERFAHRFLEASGVHCRIDIPIQIDAHELTAEARHNTFLAFKEAVNNAVKHAQASEVRLSVSVDAKNCVFGIKDDGVGFAATGHDSIATLPARGVFSGNGLRNMKLRMQEIGGSCEIESVEEAGTTIRLIVPLRSSGKSTKT
jgi:ligand-binding sensor domain-containing protein/signal transduction histidine kinase